MTTRRCFLAAAAAMPLVAESGLRAGCQTNAWRIDPNNFDSFLAVLDRVRNYGYHGFETGFRNVQGRFDRIAETRKSIEARGLEFLGCHIFLTKYDEATAVAPSQLIDSVIKGAAALGARRLILSGAACRQDAAALRRKVAALNDTARKCRQHNIRLAYHNHDLEFLNDAAEMEEMLSATEAESLRLLLDAGHVIRARADVARFFRRHAARIDGVHLRDFRRGDQVPLGDGDVDWKPLVAAARESNWTGWIINEEERLNDEKPGDSAVGPARTAVKRLFGI
jgi:sugar phosphate isomerase/epimerase